MRQQVSIDEDENRVQQVGEGDEGLRGGWQGRVAGAGAFACLCVRGKEEERREEGGLG